jgi:hypothetical protein
VRSWRFLSAPINLNVFKAINQRFDEANNLFRSKNKLLRNLFAILISKKKKKTFHGKQ